MKPATLLAAAKSASVANFTSDVFRTLRSFGSLSSRSPGSTTATRVPEASRSSSVFSRSRDSTPRLFVSASIVVTLGVDTGAGAGTLAGAAAAAGSLRVAFSMFAR